MTLIIDMQTPDEVTDEAATPPATLVGLAAQLVGTRLPPSYLEGKTRLRDEVVRVLGCSLLEAERAVDRLIAQGHAQFDDDAKRWRIGPVLTL